MAEEVIRSSSYAPVVQETHTCSVSVQSHEANAANWLISCIEFQFQVALSQVADRDCIRPVWAVESHEAAGGYSRQAYALPNEAVIDDLEIECDRNGVLFSLSRNSSFAGALTPYFLPPGKLGNGRDTQVNQACINDSYSIFETRTIGNASVAARVSDYTDEGVPMSHINYGYASAALSDSPNNGWYNIRLFDLCAAQAARVDALARRGLLGNLRIRMRFGCGTATFASPLTAVPLAIRGASLPFRATKVGPKKLHVYREAIKFVDERNLGPYNPLIIQLEGDTEAPFQQTHITGVADAPSEDLYDYGLIIQVENSLGGDVADTFRVAPGYETAGELPHQLSRAGVKLLVSPDTAPSPSRFGSLTHTRHTSFLNPEREGTQNKKFRVRCPYPNCEAMLIHPRMVGTSSYRGGKFYPQINPMSIGRRASVTVNYSNGDFERIDIWNASMRKDLQLRCARRCGLPLAALDGVLDGRTFTGISPDFFAIEDVPWENIMRPCFWDVLMIPLSVKGNVGITTVELDFPNGELESVMLCATFFKPIEV